MSAASHLQSSAVSCLETIPGLNGVFLDAPARAAFPFVVIGCAAERDWSCLQRQGREIRLEIALWDEQPGRLMDLEDKVELDRAMLVVPPGWKITTLVLEGKKRSRQPGGPWSCVASYRARMIADPSGSEG